MSTAAIGQPARPFGLGAIQPTGRRQPRGRRLRHSSAARPAHATTRLRMTARGKRVLAALIAAPLATALSFGVIAGDGAQASRDASDVVFSTVSVAPGDTLWSIAERVAPATDPRDAIEAIKRLNALDSAVLIAGDELAIPADLR